MCPPHTVGKFNGFFMRNKALGENFKCIWRPPHLCKYPALERGVILCLLLNRCKNPPTLLS
jgi:hypothetical protein